MNQPEWSERLERMLPALAVLALLVLASLLWTGCSDGSNDVAGGSATDVGNPSMTGRIQGTRATGSLIDAAGQPVANAIVTLVDTGYNPFSQGNRYPILRDTTDPQGAFSLDRPEAMGQGYTLFADFADTLSFAFSPLGIAGDSLSYEVEAGAWGEVDLLLPFADPADTAGLYLYLKGTDRAGSFAQLYVGDLYWEGTGWSYMAFRLPGVPFGFVPEVRWLDSNIAVDDWIIRGFVSQGDRLQIIGQFNPGGSIGVVAIYRVTSEGYQQVH